MNNYNENLRSSVLASLNDIELDQKKIKSANNAAMSRLYFSEGATINAADKLQGSKNEQEKREKIKTEAVNDSNLSVNLLKSANNANEYLSQSVTNSAVAASNVQVAANAIVRLSGDIGNIYNIARAMDFDTEIYKQANDANDYIKQTAGAAEIASQLGMETSVLIAKVSGPITQDKATSTNGAIDNILKALSADYDSVSALVATENAALASASAKEKMSEGVYEDTLTDLEATNNAYQETVNQLNMGLSVSPVAGSEANSFKVDFNWLQSPFGDPSGSTPPNYTHTFRFPVQQYYLFVVKDKQKSTFSIHNAEDILQKGAGEINPQCIVCTPNKKPAYSEIFNYMQIPGSNKQTYFLNDSDGDHITTGTDYVVFVMAQFQDSYKKKLNTFDEFLSAPSTSFRLTNVLAAASFLPPLPDNKLSAITLPGSISFSVSENTEFAGQVEYRCILLPMKDFELTSEMETTESLKELEAEIKSLTDISSEIQPKLIKLQAAVMDIRSNITDTIEKKGTITAIYHHYQKLNEYKRRIKDEKVKTSRIESFTKSLHSTNKEFANASRAKDDLHKTATEFIELLFNQLLFTFQLSVLAKEKKAADDKIKAVQNSKLNFLFNLKLAEQVTAGNYIPITNVPVKSTGVKQGKQAVSNYPAVTLKVQINTDATDNFGNPLITDKTHKLFIPVILSVSTVEEENQSKFTSNWTGYKDSPVLLIK